MTFPTRDTLNRQLNNLQGAALGIKNYCTSERSAMVAGDYSSISLLDLYEWLIARDKKLVEYGQSADVAELNAYAKEQLVDPALVMTDEFTALRAAISPVTDWIIQNFPKDGNTLTHLSYDSVADEVVEVMFTTTQTAPLVLLLDTLIATIE